jgi:hypothetical protein
MEPIIKKIYNAMQYISMSCFCIYSVFLIVTLTSASRAKKIESDISIINTQLVELQAKSQNMNQTLSTEMLASLGYETPNIIEYVNTKPNNTTALALVSQKDKQNKSIE